MTPAGAPLAEASLAGASLADASLVGATRSLDPKQVTVWRLGWGALALALVGLAAAAEAVIRLADADWPLPIGAVTFVVALTILPVAWRLPQVAFDRWHYELADTSLELRRGVVVQTHTAIPYFRVQHIDITRSPMERALGLSQLVVRTAAASTDATIPGVAVADADELRRVILARTGRGDAV